MSGRSERVPVFIGWDGAGDAPCSWEDLNLDQLGHTPPRTRQMFRADGQPWTDPDGLLLFATTAELQAWEVATSPK